MARVEGRVNGDVYELVQGGAVRHSYPVDEARADEKLRRAIQQNAWEPLP